MIMNNKRCNILHPWYYDNFDENTNYEKPNKCLKKSSNTFISNSYFRNNSGIMMNHHLLNIIVQYFI